MNNLFRKISNDKTIIFACFIFAVILWFSSQLSKTIIAPIELNVLFNSSQKMTLASDVPSIIKIDVIGSGWSLLFSELKNHAIWNLNLSPNKEIIYSEDDIIRFLHNDFKIENIKLSNIRPSHIFIKQDSLIYKEVPIDADVNTIALKGYIPRSGIRIDPSKIVLIGPSDMLSKIDNWSIGKISLNQTDNELIINKTIQLNSGNDLLKLDPNIIKISTSFEELTEKTISIPVHVDTSKEHIERIFPKEILVKLRVGLSKFHLIDASNFELGLDIESTNESNINIVKIRKAPSGNEIIDLTPSYVEVYFKDK